MTTICDCEWLANVASKLKKEESWMMLKNVDQNGRYLEERYRGEYYQRMWTSEWGGGQSSTEHKRRLRQQRKSDMHSHNAVMEERSDSGRRHLLKECREGCDRGQKLKKHTLVLNCYSFLLCHHKNGNSKHQQTEDELLALRLHWSYGGTRRANYFLRWYLV